MISYIGHEHFRQFENLYEGHDVWVFGHRPRRASHCIFGEYGHAFQTFKQSHYKQMLLLKKAVRVPLILESETVIHYKGKNESIATLWPKWTSLPTNDQDLEWLTKHHITIETLYL